MPPKHQRWRWVSIPAKLGGTMPLPKHRGRTGPDQPSLRTRSEASVSSLIHHSFQPAYRFEGAAAEQAHGADERYRVPFVA